MTRPAVRADARANRERLIAAAHEVFRERGIDAEMKEIAERAGVGIGTIYRNFPTKDDLFAALVRELIERIQEILSAAAVIDDPVEAIHTLIVRGFRLVEAYGDMGMAMHGNIPEDCREQLAGFDFIHQLVALVRRGIDRDVFRADLNPEVVAVALKNAFAPWTYQLLSHLLSIDAIADAYADLFLGGMLAHPDQAAHPHAPPPARARSRGPR
jgi:AcrR family transcriptional regulator